MWRGQRSVDWSRGASCGLHGTLAEEDMADAEKVEPLPNFFLLVPVMFTGRTEIEGVVKVLQQREVGGRPIVQFYGARRRALSGRHTFVDILVDVGWLMSLSLRILQFYYSQLIPRLLLQLLV